MRTWFTIFIFFIFLRSYSQIPHFPNKLNEKGERIGQWIILFDSLWNDTKMDSLAFYYRIIKYNTSGIVDGTITDYFRNGIKQMELFPEKVNPNDSTGFYIYYHPNGHKRSEGFQYGKKENGEWKYFLEDGRIFFTTEYINGIKQGWEKAYLNASNYFVGGFIDSTVFYLNLSDSLIEKEYLLKENDSYNSSVSYLGMLYFKLGYYFKAKIILQKIIKYYSNSAPDSKELAWVKYNLGYLYSSLGEYKIAKEYYISCLNIFEKISGGNSLASATVMNNIGLASSNLGDYKYAEECYNKCFKIYKDSLGENHNYYATTLINLGDLYQITGRVQLADSLYTLSKEILIKNYGENNLEFTVCLKSIANLNIFRENYLEAELILKKTIEINKHIFGEQHLECARSYRYLADLYRQIGRDQDAENYYLIALKSYALIIGKVNLDYIICINNLSLLYLNEDKYSLADSLLVEAISLMKGTELERNPLYAISLCNLGLIYGNRNNYAAALDYFKQSALIQSSSQSSISSIDYATTLNDMAFSLEKLNKIKEAELTYLNCIDIIKKEQKTYSYKYLTPLNNLANFYISNNYFEKASPLYLEINSIIRNIFINKLSFYSEGDKTYFFNKMNYYLVNFYRYELSKKVLDSGFIDILNSNNLLYKGNFLTGILQLKRTVYQSNNPKLINLFNEWVLNKKYLIQQLETISSSSKDSVILMQDKLREIENAINIESINVSDILNLNKQFNWENIQKSLENDEAIVDIIRIPLPKKDSIITSCKKIIGIGYEFKENKLILKSVTDSMPAFYAGLKVGDEILELNGKEINSFIQNNDSLILPINDSDFVLLKIKKSIGGIFTTTIKKKIICQYDTMYFDSVLYFSLITTKETIRQPKYCLINNGASLEGQYYLEYQNKLGLNKNVLQSDFDSFKEFWSPIDSIIKEKKIIYLSPDGIYNKINPLTFITQNGKYLIDEKEIRLVTSTRDVVELKRKKQSKIINDAVLVGDPQFDLLSDKSINIDTNGASNIVSVSDVNLFTQRSFESANISELPATKKEIESISYILINNDWRVQSLSGELALEESVKSVTSPRVLHIATHGYFSRDIEIDSTKIFLGMNSKKVIENPLLRSGLLLAGAKNTIESKYDPLSGHDNGILTAYEVSNMNLDSTELVVLSACETGLGEIKNGEGVYGLQRAFKIAGAKSLIMSLWKVDDNATRILMTSFYKKWLSGKSKREAFKEAQTELRSNPLYEHPYYWGGFVYVGE